jgi:hypothetical protein
MGLVGIGRGSPAKQVSCIVGLGLLNHSAHRIILVGQIQDAASIGDGGHAILVVVGVGGDASAYVGDGCEPACCIVGISNRAANIVGGLGNAPLAVVGQGDGAAIGRGAKDIATIIAIAVGGLWAYFNYFRKRTYKRRVECSLNVSFTRIQSQSLMVIAAQAKNVGLSRVKISQSGTALFVYMMDQEQLAATFPVSFNWNSHDAAFEVFTDHGWIEPGELINQPLSVKLPEDGPRMYKVVLKLTSPRFLLAKPKLWTTETIVTTEIQETTNDHETLWTRIRKACS